MVTPFQLLAFRLGNLTGFSFLTFLYLPFSL
jgi:hypothetical protein